MGDCDLKYSQSEKIIWINPIMWSMMKDWLAFVLFHIMKDWWVFVLLLC